MELLLLGVKKGERVIVSSPAHGAEESVKHRCCDRRWTSSRLSIITYNALGTLRLTRGSQVFLGAYSPIVDSCT